MYEVFFTKRARCDPEDVLVLDHHAIPESMPFLVETETLDYPAELNAFLRHLPFGGAHSPVTWKTCAYELATWCRFLAERRARQGVWAATKEDAETYYRSRRITDPATAISAASWNQLVGHLVRLYDYGVEHKLLAENPFRRGKRWTIQGIETARDDGAVRERHAKQDSMRFHTLEEYTRLRDVGFRGHLPAGGVDPDYSPRDAERNVAFVEMLVTTGMRVAEATATCRHELLVVPPEGLTRAALVTIPSGVTKNRKARKVLLPLRVQAELRSYVEIEREIAVAKANAAGVYDKGDWVLVTAHDNTSYTTKDGKRRWEKCPSELRKRLLEVRADETLDPFWTWLSSNGKPISKDSWTAAFVIAVARCKRHGINLESSPHKLRHTFAVHMLNLLERQKVGAARLAETKSFSGNSLRTVQLLLGHSSLETTSEFYLGTADLMSELLDAAAGEYVTHLERAAV